MATSTGRLWPPPTSTATCRPTPARSVLDLRNVADLDALDGRTLDLEASFGRVEVILPPGLSATVDAEVHGGGHIELFGSERGGFEVSDTVHHIGGTDAPEITIEIDVNFGEIRVHSEEAAA